MSSPTIGGDGISQPTGPLSCHALLELSTSMTEDRQAIDILVSACRCGTPHGTARATVSIHRVCGSYLASLFGLPGTLHYTCSAWDSTG